MYRFLAALLVLLPVVAAADSGSIKVDRAWSRAAVEGHEGVVYLTIANSGPRDTLIAASTPVAGVADLHQTTNDNGVMKMRPVHSLPIDAGKTVTLAPGGYHIMLMGLKKTLKQGDDFPVTLTFEKMGAITVTAMVEKAGATSRSMSTMSDHMNMPMSGGSKP
jgi:periplasmic copper chaperone A